MKKVIVIVGPTASGKSNLAIKLAKAFNTEIISGDSVQVYRELNIGSAKVTEDEMQHVKHHLLDVASIKTPYSVYDFQKEARKHLEQIDIPIICGGTGLYIQALLYDYQFKASEKNYETLEKQVEYLKKTLPDLKIDYQNPRRVNSAYQLALKGINRNDIVEGNNLIYDPLIIYLDIDRSKYDALLRKRVLKQIESGFIDEVKQLDQDLNIIGYKQIYAYLNQQLTLDEAIESIIIKSRQLAKRQKTWFLNKMNVHKFKYDDPLLFEKVQDLCDEFLTKR